MKEKGVETESREADHCRTGGFLARFSQPRVVEAGPLSVVGFADLPSGLLTTFSVVVTDDHTEAPLILRRSDERTDHAAVVARIARIEYVQPKVIARLIRIASQVTKVFRQYKRGVVSRVSHRSTLG